MPRRTDAPQRLLTTVLFTDIVGSTERAAQLGDQRWRQLLAAHHRLVRRQLKRFGGKEVDTAGDGFFATFDQPARAIECAEAVLTDVGRLGIEVRAGIHMGEVEVMGPKVGGIAVHIGARVMAKARPGQVLVSSTVRDLMSGSDVDFQDLGSHELKGVPAQWHLYAVQPRPSGEAEEGTPPSVVEEPPRRRSPLVPALVAVLVAVALVAGAVVVLTGHHPPSFRVGPNTVVQVDPSTGKVKNGAGVGTTPIAISSGDGTVWVANFDDRTLQAVDASKVVASPAFGGLPGNPSALAVGGGFVWVTIFQGGALRIDPRQHNASTPLDVGAGAGSVTFGLGSAWITSSQSDTLFQIDPSRPDQPRPIALDPGSGPAGVATGAGSVWVAESLAQQVARVDPVAGRVTERFPLLKGNPTQVAFGDGYVWATDMADDSVLRIDPVTKLRTTIAGVCDGPEGIVAGPEGVWVACSNDGTLAEIQATRVVRRVVLGNFSVEGVAETAGSVWVTVHSR